jgi:DNA-binding HxlR family transcriptional regulator
MDKKDSVRFHGLGKAETTMLNAASTPQNSVSGGCPVTAFQKMVNGKYKLRIVWDLQGGPLRYSQIGATLLRGQVGTQAISPRVLSRELKALVTAGLIEREDFGTVPPKVEYRLTDVGRSLIPVIATIRDWGHHHLTEGVGSNDER